MRSIVVLDHTEPAVAARIVTLQRAAYAVEASLIGFDAIPPLHETRADIVRLDLTILGAVEQSALAGVLGYRRVHDLVDIDRLAVEPASFRQGVARSLMEALHTREADALRFEVSTGARNEPAIALYTGMGYRQEHTETISGVKVTHLALP